MAKEKAMTLDKWEELLNSPQGQARLDYLQHDIIEKINKEILKHDIQRPEVIHVLARIAAIFVHQMQLDGSPQYANVPAQYFEDLFQAYLRRAVIPSVAIGN